MVSRNSGGSGAVRRASLCAWVVFAWITASAGTAPAVGFDDNDFLVAGYAFGDIAVYDAPTLAFKGYLDRGFSRVASLALDHAGNVVAGGSSPNEVRVYNPAGTQVGGFTGTDIGFASEIAVLPNGNYLIATGTYTQGLSEYTPAGAWVRKVGDNNYSSVALLPGNRAFAGAGASGFSAFGYLYRFDLAAGTQTPVNWTHGQMQAMSLHYSAPTDTVLIGDDGGEGIYERTPTGAFVRKYSLPTGFITPDAVTRGPNGTVWALDPRDNLLHRWGGDGAYLGVTNLSPQITGTVGLLWTGAIPVPEPGTAAAGLAALLLLASHRRRR
jgi:MYXO-CTERM domain-containing protein